MAVAPSKAATLSPLLGCIADDVTGATDLATNLVQGGMQVIQWLQVPTQAELREHPAQATIIALKIRSIAPELAVTQALEALEALREAGCRRFFFKYCSTFDSTERGNIGPVSDAILRKLSIHQTVFCPAFPKNGRTVYQGHAFVGDKLLNESGMERHPLNPMTDANLVRFLAKQSNGRVGLLAYHAIEGGVEAILSALTDLAANGMSHIVLDCLCDRHLQSLAEALVNMPFITGGSGIARYLPQSYRSVGLLKQHEAGIATTSIAGRAAILSGSCSSATIRQVAMAAPHCDSWQVNTLAAVEEPQRELNRFADWIQSLENLQRPGPLKPLLIYSTAEPNAVQQIQTRVGREQASQAIEDFHAKVACELTERAGVRVLVVAGGETSGAVVNALGIRALRIGSEICPGVPWTTSIGEREYSLALKSGNFGDDDFFLTALKMGACKREKSIVDG